MIAIRLDLGDFDSIREFVATINERFPKFHCLINNAGLAVVTNSTTKNGIEEHTGLCFKILI
jgi:short-subunit dehydrogenase involved in D-alanine esterification of teichoic acids